VEGRAACGIETEALIAADLFDWHQRCWVTALRNTLSRAQLCSSGTASWPCPPGLCTTMQRHATPCARAGGCVSTTARCSSARVPGPAPSARPAHSTRGVNSTVRCSEQGRPRHVRGGCAGSVGGSSRSGVRGGAGGAPMRALSLRCRSTTGAGEDLPQADQRIAVRCLPPAPGLYFHLTSQGPYPYTEGGTLLSPP
jgi:hypothetical protein